MAGLCCCMSLKIGTIILAITDAVYNGILFLTMIFVGIYVIQPDEPGTGISSEIPSIVISLVAIIASLCQILLAVDLGRAAKKVDANRLRRWLIIAVVVLVILIANVCLKFTLMTKNLNMPFGIVGFISVVFKLYEMVVVICYIREIKTATVVTV